MLSKGTKGTFQNVPALSPEKVVMVQQRGPAEFIFGDMRKSRFVTELSPNWKVSPEKTYP